MEVLLPASDAFTMSSPSTMPQSLSAMLDQTSSPVFVMQSKHNNHPSFPHLTLLVSEAVLEVVFVCLLGYIAAKRGMFSGEAQKTMANLNIYFFTPCLIFSKLAKQLEGEKLMELAIIPVILLVQTLVSFTGSRIMVRLFRIRKRPQINFVTAMAVFGNSNSLPLSLVISLAHTISGLHWDKVPNDNDNEVAARGILYLLIFSQLGQALRWSWGMNTLLKPLKHYTPEELGDDHSDTESVLLPKDDSIDNSRPSTGVSSTRHRSSDETLVQDHTIITDETTAASSSHYAEGSGHDTRQRVLLKLPNGEMSVGNAEQLPPVVELAEQSQPRSHGNHEVVERGLKRRLKSIYQRSVGAIHTNTVPHMNKAFHSLPPTLQKGLSRSWYWIRRISIGIKECINVPLAAIIVSVIVATIPGIKSLFYTPGSFINNTLVAGINQIGGVAVPLVLFILGGNLCRSTQPQDDPSDLSYKKEKKRMLICALASRLVIPLFVMAPILALTAKYLPISILADPIFLIVCFLLTGAPSALQLAQMCQVNDVYVPVMANMLVHSYAIWIFPSTLILVLLALEVVEFAAPTGRLGAAAVLKAF